MRQSRPSRQSRAGTVLGNWVASPLWVILWILLVAPVFAGEAPSGADVLFQQHGAVMLLIEPESGVIVDANPAAARFYGYPADQLRQMRIQQINTLTAEEILQERLRAVARRSDFFIFRHRLASGELRTVEVHSSPVQIAGRSLLLSIIHDATGRQDITARLAQDEARLRHAEHVAGYGHWIFDLRQQNYTLSAGAEKILGLDGEQWREDEIDDLFLPESRRLIEQARQRLVETGKIYDIQLRVKRADDGRILDLHSHATYDPEKRQLFGIIQDVTDYAQAMRDLESQSRSFAEWMSLGGLVQFAVIFLLVLALGKLRGAKQALEERKAALREHSDMIQLLLDSTAEAIYGIDLEGRCTFCNAASLKLLGYTGSEQLVGRKMHNLIHHSRADGTPLPLEDCAIYRALVRQQGTHVDSEVLWRGDGTSFPAEYWSYPLIRDGRMIGAVVTFLDITVRKRTEEALREKNAELERFTYAASHDLKSPLVTIKAFLGFLSEDIAAADGQRIARDMRFLHGAVDNMQQLLDELLEMARVGQLAGSPVAVRLGDLVEEALVAVAGRIVERGVEVRIEEEELTLFGDRPRLVQIWQNLIDNAVKYIGEQPVPLIEVGVDHGRGGPVFYVRDNGIGIETESRDQVFAPFEQLDPHKEGSGLGLALVKRIVERNGGRIWVDSAGAGQGSCFRFTLPAAFAEAQGETPERACHG